jgi:hypothetical protein
MSETTLIKAPPLILDAGNRVIDRETRQQMPGIVVLNADSAAPAAPMSPYAVLKIWSEFRQSSAKTNE